MKQNLFALHSQAEFNATMLMMTKARFFISIFAIVLILPFTINVARAYAVDRENVVNINNMPPPFPSHWGPPPTRQTRDLVQLPGEYGRGSGTLRKWILEKMAGDDAAASKIGSSTKSDVSTADDGKVWPEKDLVGMTAEEAKLAVLAGDSTLLAVNIHIVPQDSMVTMDYREDRVRIFVDNDGKVARQPMKG